MPDAGHTEQDQPSQDIFGLEAVRELLRLISETDVTEIQIEHGEAKLHIKRGVAQQSPPFLVTPSMAAALPQALHSAPLPPVAPFQQPPPPSGELPAPAAEAGLPPGAQAITSPMVGTFYASPSPKDPPFVKDGDEVRAGDVIGIVEAMKIMNEIESEFSGKVLRVLVQSGQPVEYGQALIVVVPE